jgi:ribosome-associated heat shock protein Hsp15
MSVRVDKWLWAVRVFKSRGISTDACKRGRVLVNGLQAKPSRELRTGDQVTVRKPPVLYSYKVKEITDKRVSARLVSKYIDDETSLEELDKLKISETFFFKRERGTGRPTKRDRRQMDKLRDQS